MYSVADTLLRWDEISLQRDLFKKATYTAFTLYTLCTEITGTWGPQFQGMYSVNSMSDVQIREPQPTTREMWTSKVENSDLTLGSADHSRLPLLPVPGFQASRRKIQHCSGAAHSLGNVKNWRLRSSTAVFWIHSWSQQFQSCSQWHWTQSSG